MKRKIILSIALTVILVSVVLVSAWATTYGASIYKGWNLVYGFQSSEQIDTIDKSNIRAIYAFIPTTQQYLRAWPNPDEKAWQNLDKVIDDHELLQTAYWVYSDITIEGSLNGLSHFTEYWVYDAPVHYTERPIYKGWNFIGVTKDMISGSKDTNLKDIKGNCDIEKSYFWIAEMQKWEDAPIEYAQLEERSLGSGWVIKVSDNCKLGTSSGGNTLSVPNLPGDQKACSDSDGGMNYNTKGTASKEGLGDITDFCVNNIKLSETLCNNDGNPAYAQYDCPNGCDNGACNSEGQNNQAILGRKCTTNSDCPNQYTDWSCKNGTTAQRYISYYSCEQEKSTCQSSPGGVEYENCANGCLNSVCN